MCPSLQTYAEEEKCRDINTGGGGGLLKINSKTTNIVAVFGVGIYYDMWSSVKFN